MSLNWNGKDAVAYRYRERERGTRSFGHNFLVFVCGARNETDDQYCDANGICANVCIHANRIVNYSFVLLFQQYNILCVVTRSRWWIIIAWFLFRFFFLLFPFRIVVKLFFCSSSIWVSVNNMRCRHAPN